jgi:hypothetical protein
VLDPDAAGDLANYAIVLLAISVVVGFWYLWKLTDAGGFIWKSLGVTYLMVVRILLVTKIEPFVKYSAPFALPFYVMMTVGVWLTVFKLRAIYIKRKREQDVE